MSKIFLVIITMLITIILNGYLEALHSNLYNIHYNECKKEFIKNNNYETLEQIFECVSQKTSMKILGTILFREGSIL